MLKNGGTLKRHGKRYRDDSQLSIGSFDGA